MKTKKILCIGSAVILLLLTGSIVSADIPPHNHSIGEYSTGDYTSGKDGPMPGVLIGPGEDVVEPEPDVPKSLGIKDVRGGPTVGTLYERSDAVIDKPIPVLGKRG